MRAFSRNFNHAWESPTIHAESPAKSWKPNAGGKKQKSPRTNWPCGLLADMWIFADMACSFEVWWWSCLAGGLKNPRTWLTPGWTSFCRGHQRTWACIQIAIQKAAFATKLLHPAAAKYSQPNLNSDHNFSLFFSTGPGPAFVQCLPGSAGKANQSKTSDWPATALSLLLQMTSCYQLEVKQCDHTQTIAQTLYVSQRSVVHTSKNNFQRNT